MLKPTLDLLQFHWWDYHDTNYLDALTYLSHLRDEGKVRHLGLTNFDTDHLKRIVDHGVRVVSNQVQYSLIDRRPEVRMIQFCQEHDIQLLAYGTLCGGLLSEKYLGQPEPGRGALNTASLLKYKQMVDAWGGWDLFQELLAALKGVADKHGGEHRQCGRAVRPGPPDGSRGDYRRTAKRNRPPNGKRSPIRSHS